MYFMIIPRKTGSNLIMRFAERMVRRARFELAKKVMAEVLDELQ
jgi:hypothetical protein